MRVFFFVFRHRGIASLLLVVAQLLLLPVPVSAEIEVPMEVVQDMVWTKEGSPYHVSGFVAVRPGVNISIEPGTVVVFADNAHLQVLQSALSIVGTEAEPVIFTGSATSSSWALDVIGPLASSTKSLVATHARFENAYQGLYLQSADAVLSNIDFIGGQDGIYLSSSTLALSNSQLSGMSSSAISIDQRSTLTIASTSITDLARAGINVDSNSHLIMRSVQIERLGRRSAVGIYNSTADIEGSSFVNGQGSAVEVYGDIQRGESRVSIHHSAFRNFSDQLVYNGGHTVVSAEKNWWGSKAGPQDAVYGEVSVSPWLLRPLGEQGDSSTLFIPGIQASRLVKGDNQLWEPNRNADVEKLYLDSAGEALVADIHPSGIIDSVDSVGVGPNIYKSFIEMLDSFVAQKQMHEWLPLPYDWRFSASTAASDESVEQLVRMASSSFTGKVNIVAHSNGGLVAKHLLQRLAERHLDIVDKVVFVATPQLGTPQAIASVLHGDGLQFAGGIILKQSVGRRLAQYSPGALGLLPTQEYFNAVSNASPPFPPVVRFSSTTDLVSMNFFQAYGDRLDSAARLGDFLSATIDKRTPPGFAEIDTPSVIASKLLASSTPQFSQQYPPAEISVIAGWGLDTLSAIEYSGRRHCTSPSLPKQIFSLCDPRTTLRRDPVWTRLGDKTVVLASALGVPGSTYFVDLSRYNSQRLRVSRNHADMLEVPQVRTLIGSILHTLNESDETTMLLPEYVATSSPKLASVPKQIRVSVHSPVSLDLYDGEGNHTGLLDATSTPSSDNPSPFIVYGEGVPGSQYSHFGEAKYLSFTEPTPFATGHVATTSRTVRIRSIGAGLVTIDVEYVDGDIVIDRTIFSDIPVTPFTNIIAELTLPLESFDSITDTFFLQASAATSTATTTRRKLVPDQGFDPVEYLFSVRQVIREICMSQRLRLELLARLSAYIGLFEKGELPTAQAQLREMVIVSDPETQHLLDTAESRGSYVSAVEAMLSRIGTLSGNR